MGVIDLISGLIKILWLEAKELQDTTQQVFAPIKP